MDTSEMIRRSSQNRKTLLGDDLRRSRSGKPRGIALMMTLVVVMLMTIFISEFFFSSGLEVRALQTYKEVGQARDLARLAFQAFRISLLQDEITVMQGYRELETALQTVAIPWEDGLLTGFTLIPLDSLYNLNELSGIRLGSDREKVRWSLFLNTMSEITKPSDIPDQEPVPIDEQQIGVMFASLYDWIDTDEVDYVGLVGVPGGESAAYLSKEPERVVKNGKLDQLREIRAVTAVSESEIPWSDLEKRLAVLPRSEQSELYPEKLNVNVATQEEIVEFLERRKLEAGMLTAANNQQLQNGINAFADQAEEVAALLAPEEGRKRFSSDRDIQSALSGLQTIEPKYAKELFSISNTYYFVRIATMVNDIEVSVEGVVRAKRDPKLQGKASSVEVLQFIME